MAGSYAKPELAKRAVGLTEENTADIEWLKDNIPKANRQVENDLAEAFSSVFPTDETSDLFKSFSDAAIAFLKYQRAIYQSDKDGEETTLKEYDKIINGIRSVAKSKPTEYPATQQESYAATIQSPMLNNIPGMTDQYGNFFSSF